MADADREPTDSHERLFYYQSRYYDTTVYLENEKRDPRILLPECNSTFFRMRFAIVETGRLHSTSIFDLLWYDQDTKIISVGADLVCQIMDVETQRVLQQVQDHVGSIKTLSQTPDGAIIATGGRDGKIFFYDMRQGLHKALGEFMFS